jgi:hypothetical protein
MKRIFISVLALLAAGTSAALADDHNHQMAHGRPMHHASYHEGQVYQGHKLHNNHGHWGYYQRRGGSNVFINIPL